VNRQSFLEDLAPRTCAKIWQLLPVAQVKNVWVEVSGATADPFKIR
jgi:hypothetical protein